MNWFVHDGTDVAIGWKRTRLGHRFSYAGPSVASGNSYQMRCALLGSTYPAPHCLEAAVWTGHWWAGLRGHRAHLIPGECRVTDHSAAGKGGPCEGPEPLVSTLPQMLESDPLFKVLKLIKLLKFDILLKINLYFNKEIRSQTAVSPRALCCGCGILLWMSVSCFLREILPLGTFRVWLLKTLAMVRRVCRQKQCSSKEGQGLPWGCRG